MAARPADRLAITIAQLNPTVGDIAGNTDKVRHARKRAIALDHQFRSMGTFGMKRGLGVFKGLVRIGAKSPRQRKRPDRYGENRQQPLEPQAFSPLLRKSYLVRGAGGIARLS